MPELGEKVNWEFLEFLKRCYRLRYTDDLPNGFNLVVFARETLAELDITIAALEFQVNLRRDGDPNPVRTPYRGALFSKAKILLEENHVLLGVDKEDFLKEKDIACAIRKRPPGRLLSVPFSVSESPRDGKFNREALKP